MKRIFVLCLVVATTIALSAYVPGGKARSGPTPTPTMEHIERRTNTPTFSPMIRPTKTIAYQTPTFQIPTPQVFDPSAYPPPFITNTPFPYP